MYKIISETIVVSEPLRDAVGMKDQPLLKANSHEVVMGCEERLITLRHSDCVSNSGPAPLLVPHFFHVRGAAGPPGPFMVSSSPSLTPPMKIIAESV